MTNPADKLSLLMATPNEEPVSQYKGVVQQTDDSKACVLIDGGTAVWCDTMDVKALVGDRVRVEVRKHKGTLVANYTHPVTDDAVANAADNKATEALGKVETLEVDALKADSAVIKNLQADTAKVHNLTADQLSAATAYVGELTAGDVTAQSIIADKAKLAQVDTNQLNADHAVIETLDSTYASIDNLNAATARIGNIEADYLVAADMTAEQARVGQLMAGKADVADLTAVNARIDNLQSTKADISVLESDYITADAIDATYLHADMSNADVAWIQNGVIKDGSISNAMINDVSANKLTAGTINGSVINVTNLNADNITAGTINGQRIGEGSLSLDKLSEDVYTEAEVDTIVEGLNDRIDGAIETHTGTTAPTLNNAPASAWNTTALRDEHVGDVYYVVNSQSQQNGYCYRFTKSGSTYSWQLIKDSDVTAALSRLTTAEGKITTFDSDISTLKTDTGTLKTKTESLETRMSDAEDDILDKVDTTTFNEVSDTVDQHSQTITQMSQTLSNKADGSTVTALTTRVSKNEQDITGINTTIGELSTTVESKADGSTVESVSNRLNTVSDTVDGHTQTLTSVQNTLSSKADSSTVSSLTTKVNNVSDTVDGHTQTIGSIESTQTTMQGKLDKTIVETTQLWYSKSSTDAPSKPTSQVTSTSTAGNAWRTVVPAYNASYPNYFYCYQWKYTDGTYGWSSVTRDIAMGESQERARTAITNAATADTKATNAASVAATAQSTAEGAASDASQARSDAASAVTTANTAASDASTALSTANTANTNASTAVTTANTAAADASTANTNASAAVSTANTAKATADKNVKSTLQLWYTKANDTAPSKPTSKVTSTSVSGNAWRTVVPTYSASYPYYFYCYQYELADGTCTWSDVVYDRATTENQSNSRSAVADVSTLTTKTNTISDTVDGHTSQLSSITTTQTSIQGSAVKSTVQLWFTKANTTAPNKPTAHVTTNNASTANAWNLAVPTYNASYPNYFYCYEYQYLNDTYGWSAVTRDIATGEAQSTARTAASDASTAKSDASSAVSTANTANTNASNAVSTANTANTNASNAVSTANTAASDASTAKTNAAAAVSTANTANTNASSAVTTANTAKSTADKNLRESQQLWFTKANSTAPSKPTSKVTSTATTGNAWTTRVPTYSDSYKHYFYCMQYVAADGTVTWSDVIYDQATTEAQSVARAASADLTEFHQEYATFKQTTQEFESTVGETYATKAALETTDGNVSSLTTRMSTAESNIIQNARDITFRATKTEAAQMAQPNLSPYFSSSPYDRTANSYWYGMGVNSNYTFTDMGDGWMHVQCTNSGSSVIRVDWYPIKCPSVVAGQPYTWLAEVRNNASTSASSGSDFYLVQTNNCQFWGQKAIETIEGPSGASMSINIGTCGSSYVLQKVQNAETASDGHWANNDEASVVGLACWTFRCAANSSIDYEVRLSLYEGRYTGPYKPYVGSQLYASQAELKVANDAISLRATKEEVEKAYATKDESQLDRAGSGTSVAVEGAANAALKGLHVIGESVQDGTPTPSAPVAIQSVGGANLLNPVDRKGATATTSKGVTATINADGWIDVNGTVTGTSAGIIALWGINTSTVVYPAGTYTVSMETDGFEPTSTVYVQVYYDSTALGINNVAHYVTFTSTAGVKRVSLFFGSGATGTVVSGRFRLQMQLGTFADHYVPYDAIGLLVTGKNLLPTTTYETVTSTTKNGIAWTVNSDGSVTANGTATADVQFTIIANPFASGNLVMSGCPSDGSSSTYEVYAWDMTVNARPRNWSGGTSSSDFGSGAEIVAVDGHELRVVFRIRSGYVASNLTFRPQLELGSEATEYEPYSGTVTPIPLNGHELRSLPDGTCDELTVDADGRVTMVQRVGSIDFDGSGDETWSVENSGARAVSNGVTNLKFQSSNSETFNALSNRFVGITPNNTWAGTLVGISGNISIRRLYFSDGTNAMDATEWRTWLTTNPTTVLFPYETPQTIDLGTIDMPQVHDGDTVEVIAALTPSIDVTWWASAGQAVADAYASLSSAIEVRAESIVSTVSERYATSQEVQAISSQIEQTAQGWTAQFKTLTGGADLSMTLAEAFDALGVTSRNLEEIRSFVRITTDDAGDPLLLMGSATSPIMLALSNDSLRFMHGPDPVAYIDVDGTTNEGRLHITRAVVVKELQFGSWKWFERDGVGNLALKWVGDE